MESTDQDVTGTDKMDVIREELSQLTAEEMQTLKEKMGLKAFRKILSNLTKTQEPAKHPLKIPRRENKNRPTEISSKRKVGFLRKIPGISSGRKRVARDPRFDDLSGTFREDIFERDYGFLTDLKSQEKRKLHKMLKKEKHVEKKAKLRQLLNRMEQQEKVTEEKKRKKKLEKEWKQKEKERVQEGKAPFFLKKSDKKTLELADKYRILKEKGTLNNFLQKKRKKKASKERKRLPNLSP
ncbi:hypothetical protein C0Q70_13121 [Pomacea canaliculata]|uniref:rRNA biogenesis protein RRP36 n=1 Tax=Pomacea canaliculata TaxID=400727 RepID=A0A2T7NWC2_POMCA|nr:ribosomal RNA processing protein 36 homolog [Pomacea canaliculata]PVD25465.1 hypothetical protein C0Q70_13121 [Pomacea canaliculata]